MLATAPIVTGTIGSIKANQFVPSKNTIQQYPPSKVRVALLFMFPDAGVRIAVPVPMLAMKQNHGVSCVVNETAIADESDKTISAPLSPFCVA